MVEKRAGKKSKKSIAKKTSPGSPRRKEPSPASPHSPKIAFDKPGNFLYPIPAVLISLADEDGKPNLFTVAWTGTICSDPPMLSISVRKERYSYDILKKTGEFTVNLTTRELVPAADYAGVRSGRDTDKFRDTGLTPAPGVSVRCPSVLESPVSIECRVTDVIELGTHDMFLAKVLNILVDPSLLDEKGRFRMEKADLAAYSHGAYYDLGKCLGTFGFSVRKNKKNTKKSRRF